MKNANKLTPQEALELAKEEYDVSVDISTVHAWCKKYRIGKKVVGRWHVNKKRFQLLLEGKTWQNSEEEVKQ